MMQIKAGIEFVKANIVTALLVVALVIGSYGAWKLSSKYFRGKIEETKT